MSLYDDAVVALIAEGAAGKDDVLYNIKPEEKLKATELVTNGGFDTDSDWTKNTDSGQEATISGGKGRLVGDGSAFTSLQQNDVFEANKVYKVSLHAEIRSGELKVQSNGNDGNIGIVSTSGNYSFYFTGVSGSPHIVLGRKTPSVVFDIEVDNVSVKEVEQKALDFTFTRGSNLTTTRVGPGGLIEKGRENLIRYSNTLTNSLWGGSDVVYNDIVGGQQGYDGSNNAFLIDKITNGNSYVGVPVLTYDGVFTWSGYFKNEGSKNNGVYMFTPIVSQYFDLVNGQKINNPGGTNPISSSIESIGNGWYRCSVTGVGSISSGVTNDRPRFKVTNLDGSDPGTGAYNDTGKIFVQDFQFEAGLVATDYIDSPGGVTGKAGILEDSPRFDYTGVTCPHLLMEPQRTNKIKFTEAFAVGTGSGGWQKAEITVTQNNAISPEGVQNASLIVPSGAAADHYIQSGTFLSNTNEYLTFSVFAKVPPSGNQYLYINVGAARLFGIFNLSGSGSVEQVSTTQDFENGSGGTFAPTAKITALSNGWFRCSISGRSLNQNAGYVRISCAPTDQDNKAQPNAAGDGNGMLIYGSQIETGAYPTSYIPNNGTAFVGTDGDGAESGGVTRDNEQTPSTDFGDYIDGEDFTFFVDLAKNESLLRDNSSGGIRFSSTDLTASSVRLYRASGSATTYHAVWFDSELNQDPDPKSFSGSTPKVAIRRIKSTGEWAMFVDGSKVQTQYNTNYSDFKHLKIWGEGSPVHLNGTIVFDRALTDDECNALTT